MYADACPYCNQKDWIPDSHYLPANHTPTPLPPQESLYDQLMRQRSEREASERGTGRALGSGKTPSRFKAAATRITQTIGTAIGIGILGVIISACYQGADEAGWFPHDLTVTVWMKRDWFTGEFKPCGLIGNQKTANLICDDFRSTSHDMSVEFRGSLDALEAGKASKWNCQRKQESIACKIDSEYQTPSQSSANNTVERWFVRDTATGQIEERQYTLNQAIEFCNKNPKLEIATDVNAPKGAFTLCPAFVGEFK
jgi:hypothetical protein